MMYALSQEGSGDVTARRKLQETQKYGLQLVTGKVRCEAGKLKVINRQDASTTRFSGSGNGEVYYGERRQLSSDLPPRTHRHGSIRVGRSDPAPAAFRVTVLAVAAIAPAVPAAVVRWRAEELGRNLHSAEGPAAKAGRGPEKQLGQGEAQV